MKSVLKKATVLLAPLAVIFLTVFALYGIQGPPDTPKMNAIGERIGFLYGIYCVAVVMYWWKPWKKQTRIR